MTSLLYLLGVLAFVAGIGASIGLHELGHMVPAKAFGVRVTQWMIGFGPTLWSRRRGETEYGVKAIPLGGYIRMIGMFPPKRGADERMLARTSTGRMSLLVDQARNQSMEEVRPGDEHRVFYKLSVPKKVVVMMGGPTMNLVIALVLLTLTTTLAGRLEPNTSLEQVSACVLAADAAPDATCQPSDPAAPAAEAGLKPGDRILTVGGTTIRDWDDLHSAIVHSDGATTPVRLLRDGQTITVQVTPVVTERPVQNDDGTFVHTASGAVKTERVGYLGIVPGQSLQRQSLTAVPGVFWDQLSGTASVFVRIPQKMVGIVHAAFGSGQRDPNGPVSIVGVGRFAGEIASAKDTGGYSVTEKLADLFNVLAALNIALFVFNLIPLLPLDGGHVAGALWEGARRTIARARRRSDPGPTDVARMLPVAYAVSMVLIAMSALLIYADIVNPVRIG